MSQAGRITLGTGAAPIETITPNTGIVVVPDGTGNVDILGGNNITTVGTLNTLTLNVTGTTIHDVQIGNASGSLTSVTNGTTGQVLTAATGADPAWQDLPAGLTIDADTGSATGNPITFNANTNCGKSVLFAASGSTVDLEVSDANSNTYIGFQSGLASTGAAQDNTSLGHYALKSVTSGSENVVIGSAAASGLTDGAGNVVIGKSTMLDPSQASNSNNVVIGNSAGGTVPGNENVIIGANATLSGASASSNIILGSGTAVTGDNTLKIGKGTGAAAGQLAKAYICGIDGVNVGSTATVITEASDQLGTATITAGSNIQVTPGANTITIATTGITAFTWAVTTVNASIVVNNGYIANKAGLLTMTLPASGAIGDLIEITGINTAVGWRIAQNANQQIFFGASSTTLGASGYLEATDIRDSVKLVCVVSGASTVWNVLSSVGNITVN